MEEAKIFKSYDKGILNNVVTYKCWFIIPGKTDKQGFKTNDKWVVEYLNEEEFNKLPRLKKEVK